MESTVHQTVDVAVCLVVIPFESRRRNHGDYHFEISIYERVMPSAECEILIPIVLTEIAIWTPL